MPRTSSQGLPPGIQLDGERGYFVRLEGEDAALFRQRYPGRTVPRRRAKTLKEASKLQRTMIDELKRGRDPQAQNPKITDFVKADIDARRDLQPQTRARYLQAWRLYIAPKPIGRLRLQQLTKRIVDEWVDMLMEHPRKDDPERTLDPYTVRNTFAVLRAALNAAVEAGELTHNPAKGVRLPQPDDDELQPLDPLQAHTFLALVDALDNGHPHRLAALYHIAIRCGLRQGELFGLTWADVDLKRATLRVSRQMQKGARTKTKTRTSHRTIPLSADAVRALQWHHANQREEQQLRGDGWNTTKLVFCSEEGTPLNPGNITRQLDALLKRASLPDVRFHDLRHTYAALAIAADVNIYVLSKRMGHSSITVTADTYGHLYHDQTGDADAVDNLIRRAA